MKIADFLDQKSIIAHLESRTKEDVLAEMARRIAAVQELDGETVRKVLADRERLGSTGIGDGVAIPHGRMAALTHLVALLARSVEGIDFGAIDGKPTHLFFVLLTPDNNVGLQALARVSRLLRRSRCREALMNAADEPGLYRAVLDQDAQL